jgi:uncharacterized tellurite resistance protein B-like protein
MDARQALLLKTLVQMAWADKKLVDAERVLLNRVLSELGATPEEIEAFEAAPEEIDYAQLAQTLPGMPERLEAMRLLMKVAFVDNTLSFEEYDLVGRLAEALGIDDAQLERLRQQALNG